MKKISSIMEFRKLCDNYPGMKFVFNSENQLEETLENISFDLIFPKAITMTNPDRICFTDCNGYMCLKNIKEIWYSNDTKNQSIVFNIVCSSIFDDSKKHTYTILGEKSVL